MTKSSRGVLTIKCAKTSRELACRASRVTEDGNTTESELGSTRRRAAARARKEVVWSILTLEP
jgi:hypothetical protein